jgi:hypothetical protein
VVATGLVAERARKRGSVFRTAKRFVTVWCEIVRKYRMDVAVLSVAIFVRDMHSEIVKPSGAREM